jgi:hypothetical protein
MGIGGARRKAIAAATGVVIGAAVNVTTGMLTQRWELAWLAATVAFVLAGGGLLAWLTFSGAMDPADPVRVSASGRGAIAAAGSVSKSSTKVTHPLASDPPQTSPGPGESTERGVEGGVSASGLGAIAAGGDVRNSHTEVFGEEPAAS